MEGSRREIVASMRPGQAPAHKQYIHPSLWHTIFLEALWKHIYIYIKKVSLVKYHNTFIPNNRMTVISLWLKLTYFYAYIWQRYLKVIEQLRQSLLCLLRNACLL